MDLSKGIKNLADRLTKPSSTSTTTPPTKEELIQRDLYKKWMSGKYTAHPMGKAFILRPKEGVK